MKLFPSLLTLLLVSSNLANPLFGRSLGKRRHCDSVKGRLVGTILGGCGRSSRQQVQSRTATAPAPAPASAPAVNVNVQNIYNNEENKHVSHNNHIGSVKNDIVNNDVRVKQDISNRVDNNVYNKKEVSNNLVQNYQGGPQSKGYPQTEECPVAPQVYQDKYREYPQAPSYTGGYKAEQEQYYNSRDSIRAEREREYAAKARSQGYYGTY